MDRFGLDLKFEQKEMNHYLNIIDDHLVEHREGDNPIDEDDVNLLEYRLRNSINTSHLNNQKFFNRASKFCRVNFFSRRSLFLAFPVMMKSAFPVPVHPQHLQPPRLPTFENIFLQFESRYFD